MQDIHFTDDDLQSLLIKDQVQIGKHIIIIEPYGIDAISKVVTWALDMKDKLTAKKIDFDNAFEPQNIPILAQTMAKSGPSLISLATGIKTQDVSKLPLSITLDLAIRIIRINLKAAESLEKNLFQSLVELAALAKSATGILLSSSSGTATVGKTSKSTT